MNLKEISDITLSVGEILLSIVCLFDMNLHLFDNFYFDFYLFLIEHYLNCLFENLYYFYQKYYLALYIKI